MYISIGSVITVEHPTRQLEEYCKRELIVKNPEYTKKVQMGFWVGKTPQTLSLYERNGDTLILPYGCLDKILEMWDFTGDVLKHEYDAPSWVEWTGDTIPLRDYQAEAVDKMFHERRGILQAPAGTGKTQMGLALACKFGLKTLWLTNKKDLLNQSKARAEQYHISGLGTITEGKVNIGKFITFATVQTLANLDLPRYKDEWDVIIVDECHNVAGTPTGYSMFSKVLNNLRARHKYGLSATVHRADGLIKCTYSLLGEVAHIVPREVVENMIVKATIQPIATGVGISDEMLNTDGTVDWVSMISALTSDDYRNHLIADNVLDEYVADHSCLILSDRVAHLERIAEILNNKGAKTRLIHGKMISKKNKALRESYIEEMRTGESRILLATYSLAKEGLDIPRLDRLFLTTPQKDKAVIEQSVGRIQRVFFGKKDALVYDYVDDIETLVKKYKLRCTTYRKIGCDFYG